MTKPFTVHLPNELYVQAKELSQREGPPVSFLVREGLKLVLEKRKHEQDSRDAEELTPKEIIPT